jgi:hypothetical protein
MKTLLGTMVVLATMLSFAQACTMSWKIEMSHLNYEILMLEEDLERHEFGTEMYDAIYKLIWQKIYRVE